MRWKNPHPKRAVTARTVLKAPAASLDAREEEEEVEEDDDNMFTNEYNRIHSPDHNEGSVDALAGLGGRL